MPAGQIRVQIAQMLPQVLERLALRDVIRELLQVTEPKLAVLPVNVTQTFRAARLSAYPGPGNDILPAILIVGPCRINAAFRPGSERRIHAAAERRSENGQAAKAKMRTAGILPSVLLAKAQGLQAK
jgi:hypothetical protein